MVTRTGMAGVVMATVYIGQQTNEAPANGEGLEVFLPGDEAYARPRSLSAFSIVAPISAGESLI